MADTKYPVNVMFVVPCFGFGGLEQVVLSIVRALDRSRFNPSFCTLLSPDPLLYREMEQLNLPCYILDKGPGLNFSLPFKLSRLFKSENIQLVNAHDIGATLYAAPAARLGSRRLVIHTDHSQILAKSKYPSLYGGLLRKLVDASITVSLDLENYLVEKFKVKRSLVKTIPNGIDTSRFGGKLEPGRLRDELGIGPQERVIGSIGRLTRQKGMNYLLRAFRMVLENNPDTRLVIVGQGDLKDDLVHLSRELNIQERVVFAGVRQDIPSLLQLFDVFALASLWEGQPITIMEAMAAGKPIVVTDAGGNAEILDNGSYGRIVPVENPEALAESIRSLLDNPELAENLGRKAQAQAMSELSSEAMVRKYESVFASILKKT
jgi:glycosyltransferase involved in cell wall biosynthesis